MKLRGTACIFFLLICHSLLAQTAKRIAILPANGKFQDVENRVVDSLTGKVAGTNGVTIIDRASTERILKEQNFQNSDRSSLETAARIGKLVGAGQIVLVRVVNQSYTTHTDNADNSSRTVGTMVLEANARMIDVETAVVLGQPSSSFQNSAVLSETKVNKGFGGIHLGRVQVPATKPSQQTTGSDQKAVQNNELSKAVESVATDLGPKLISILGGAPGPKAELPLVAGIAKGSVYINQGTAAGIKQGDRFQVVRKVSVGLNDPKTGQPITQKQRICVLALTNVDENSSSGSCQGGLPQSGDVAEPMQP